jgi:hypothetical protein
MGTRTVRALVALGATLPALLATAAPASAAFNVTPLGCLARPQPFLANGETAGVAVFGYVNPNSADVNIPFGSDNLVLQPPNFRAGQPTTFLAGRHEAAWVTPFSLGLQPVTTWVLQGAVASTSDAVCGGGAAAQPLAPPTLGSGAASAAVGDALAVAVDRTSAGGPVLTAVERCAGAACAPATDTDNPRSPRTTYSVTAADAGYDLRLVAIRLTMRGWSSALSARVAVTGPATGPAPQEPAADASADAPEPLRKPSIAGTPGRGFTLSADPGHWAGSVDPSLAVRWQRCDATACTNIPGATGNAYVPGADDVGTRLRAVVGATASGLSTFVPTGTVTEVAASEPTPPVTPAPALESAPVIAGRADVGGELTLTGDGRFDVSVTRAIQWQSCAGSDCRDVPGATGTSYRVRDADAGHDLRAAVTATSAGGRTAAASNRIGPAGAVREIAAPRVLGTPAPGTTVWTDGGSWIGVPAPGLGFQWLRCDAAGNACGKIAGATSPGYTPGTADLGRTLRAQVTAGNGFSAATATSASSAVVTPPDAAPETLPSADRSRPVISGLAATPSRFRRSAMVTTLAPVRAPRVRRGTIVRLRLSEAAWVRVDVARGHRTIATLTRVLSAGDHRLRFTGRLSRAQGGKLPAGGYLLAVRATDAAGNVSRQRVVRVRIRS